MTEITTRVSIDELGTVRVTCDKCGMTIECKAQDAASIVDSDRPCKCRFCKQGRDARCDQRSQVGWTFADSVVMPHGCSLSRQWSVIADGERNCLLVRREAEHGRGADSQRSSPSPTESIDFAKHPQGCADGERQASHAHACMEQDGSR